MDKELRLNTSYAGFNVLDFKGYVIFVFILFPFLFLYRDFVVAEARVQFFIVTACFTALLLFFNKTLQPVIAFNIIDILFLLKTGYEILSRSIFSYDYFFSYETSESILLFFLYLYLKQYSGANTDFCYKYIVVLSVVYFIQILFGFGQEFLLLKRTTSQESLSGTFLNNTLYAHFLIINFPLVVAFIYRARTPVKYWLSGILLIIIFYLVHESRVSMIALAIVSAVIFYPWRKTIKERWIISVFMSGAIILFAIGIALLDFDSLKGRFLVWLVSIDIYTDFPFLGIGYGNFRSVYPLYQYGFLKEAGHSSDFYKLAGDINEPYNEFLRVLVEQGILGVIISVLLILIVIRRLATSSYDLKRYLLVSFVLFYFVGITSYPFSSLLLKINYLFIIVISSSLSSKKVINVAGDKRSGNLMMAGAGLICLVINLKNWREFKDIDAWRTYYHIPATQLNSDLAGSLRYNVYFMTDLANHYYQRRQYKDCLKTLHSAKHISKNSSLFILSAHAYVAMHNYDSAYLEIEFVRNLVPNLIYPKYLQVKILLNQNKKAEALAVVNEILVMPVKIRSAISDELLNEIKNIKFLLLEK